MEFSVFALGVVFQQKSQKIFQILCEARVSVLYLNSRSPTFLGLCLTRGAQSQYGSHRHPQSLSRGEAKPLVCLHVVLLHALAQVVHQAEVELGSGIALFGQRTPQTQG